MVNHNRIKDDQFIESLILDIFPMMPSIGSWPFTMSGIARSELLGLEMDKPPLADSQLLILERTDFNGADLIDYALKSKEYQTVPTQFRLEFLDKYYNLAENEQTLRDWTDKITNLAIGLVIQTALNRGRHLSSIQTDLAALDDHLGLSHKKLKAYQLYDVYQLDPSFLI